MREHPDVREPESQDGGRGVCRRDRRGPAGGIQCVGVHPGADEACARGTWNELCDAEADCRLVLILTSYCNDLLTDT